MKKIIMFVLSGLLFIGCYENETIHADSIGVWKNLRYDFY